MDEKAEQGDSKDHIEHEKKVFLLPGELCWKGQRVEADSGHYFFCFVPQGEKEVANLSPRSCLSEVFILMSGEEFFKPGNIFSKV